MTLIKSSIFSLFLLLAVSFVISQEAAPAEKAPASPWSKEAVVGFNISNTNFDNWSGGGEDATTWSLKSSGKIEQNLEKTNWKSTGKLGYGQTKLGGSGFRKSLDELFLESIYSYKFHKYLNPYASATAATQFTKGYNYPEDGSPKTTVSNFWDPGYLTQGTGIGIRPVTGLTSRLGFSVKETFSGKYGYADDDLTDLDNVTFKAEPGLESITDYSAKLQDILLYTTKLSVFVNFKGTSEIDGKWENVLSAQLAKYLTVNLSYDVVYDKDLSESVQKRQIVSLGANYSIF